MYILSSVCLCVPVSVCTFAVVLLFACTHYSAVEHLTHRRTVSLLFLGCHVNVRTQRKDLPVFSSSCLKVTSVLPQMNMAGKCILLKRFARPNVVRFALVRSTYIFCTQRAYSQKNIERSQLSCDIGGDVTLIAWINVRDWSLKSPGISYEVRRINMLFLLAAAQLVPLTRRR